MANKIVGEIKEKIKNFLLRFAKEYPNSGVGVNLPFILEELDQEAEGFDVKIVKYMTKIFMIENDFLPDAEPGTFGTHLEIMEDYLRILETGEINVLDYVYKQEVAKKYIDFLVPGIKLDKFSREWVGILAELRESLQEEDPSGDGGSHHNCVTCRTRDVCPIRGLKEHLEQMAKEKAGSMDDDGSGFIILN